MKRADVIDRIATFNRGRDPERLELKYKEMQENALAFFRGTCHLFCEDWPQSAALNGCAPLTWVCGDLHIENFGTYKGDNRLTYFDIADFDEALLASCAWDLTRLLTSVLIAAKAHELKRRHAIALGELLLHAYALALQEGNARWIERATAGGMIGALLQGLEKRTRRAFITKRTTANSKNRRLRIDGTHTLPIDDEDRKRVKRFMRKFAERQPDPAFFKVLDVARRIAGTGSLGLPRYTILVSGRGTPAGRFLLDLKYAAPSALASYVKVKQPPWKDEAARVVAVERRVQAIVPALLQAVTFHSGPYVLRELMPSQDKLDIEKWNRNRAPLESLARDLGYLVAWGQLRSSGRNGSANADELIAFGEKRKWQRVMLEYAEEYQGVAERDWRQFRDAYRDGALRNG